MLSGPLIALQAMLDAGELHFDAFPSHSSGGGSVELNLQSPDDPFATAISQVSILPVASVPSIAVQSATGFPNLPIAIPIALAGLVDTYGSESLALTIGDPSGSVLRFEDSSGASAGVEATPNEWVFTAATTDDLLLLLGNLRVVT